VTAFVISTLASCLGAAADTYIKTGYEARALLRFGSSAFSKRKAAIEAPGALDAKATNAYTPPIRPATDNTYANKVDSMLRTGGNLFVIW